MPYETDISNTKKKQQRRVVVEGNEETHQLTGRGSEGEGGKTTTSPPPNTDRPLYHRLFARGGQRPGKKKSSSSSRTTHKRTLEETTKTTTTATTKKSPKNDTPRQPQKRQRKDKRTQSRASPSPAAESTRNNLSVLEGGITRGSIANMVLARLGKLDPSELINDKDDKDDDDDEDTVSAGGDGNTSSKKSLTILDEDGEGTTPVATAQPTAFESSVPNDNTTSTVAGLTSEVSKNPGANTTNGKHQSIIQFLDGVSPQPGALIEKEDTKKKTQFYVVKSGPLVGARGTFIYSMVLCIRL
jgi:hypothetical protein